MYANDRAAPRRMRVLSTALLASTMLAGTAPALAQDASVSVVVVTAQKRVEDVQDVPVSIQVLGGEKLEELVVSDFNDYVKYLPSVSFQSTGPGFSNVYMRGVASGGDGNHSASLPSVGIYLDEQPITTIQGALDVHVYDMERVEALAGPQGTLYGASSQSGTIRLITRKPNMGAFSAALDAEINSVADGDSGYGLEGYVNAPISDAAALRVVGWYQKDAGYIDNVYKTRTYPTWGGTINNRAFAKNNYNDVSTAGARAALKVDINDDWSVTPTLMGQRQVSNGNFSFNPAQGDLKISRYKPEGATDKWYQAALTVEGKISNLDVVYAGAFMKRDVDSESDYSDYSFFYDTLFGYGAYWTDNLGNPVDPTQYIQAEDRYKKESHELRLSTPADNAIRAVGGVFLQDQTHDIQQRYRIDAIGSSIAVTGWPGTLWLTKQLRSDKDEAVFGELAWDIQPGLTLTGGLRFFRAENGLKGFFGFSSGYSGSTGEAKCFRPTPIVGNGPCTNLDKVTEETGSTHRLNLTWTIQDDRMVYATWSTGYRPGGINRRGSLPPYESDFLTNYEIGWKTSWFGRSLQWNGAAFLQKWDDFQFAILGANGLTEIKNAVQAEIPGLETDIVWRPTQGLTLTGGLAWTDGALTENYCGKLDTAGRPITVCPKGSTAFPDGPEAPDGTELPVTPRLKGNLTARYEFTLGAFDAHVQGAMSSQTSSWSDLRLLQRDILGKQSGWTTVDLSAGLSSDVWRAEVFVQNLTDERADLTRYTQCAESVCGGAVYSVPNQPRTIGLRLGREF